MEQRQEPAAPLQQSVHVDCPIEDAFRLFTDHFGAWWPLAAYSITGEEAEDCVIEPHVGGRVFERTRSGEEREWGSVLAWDPPRHVRFSWHPGTSEDPRQSVDVEFCSDADGTRVTVIHRGWERAGVQACAAHLDHATEWAAILEHYFAGFVGEQMLVFA